MVVDEKQANQTLKILKGHRRERIATAVLQGLVSSRVVSWSSEDVARTSLRIADALIAALDEENT